MATSDVRISATTRDDFGKGASRRYRRDGSVPAVMYGSGSEVRHVLLPAHELGLALRIPRVVLDVDLAGDRLLVAPRDIQKDPVRNELHHVDLIMLSSADVHARHAYADALAKAEATAEEAGLDPVAAAAVIEDAAANEENLDDVASRIVEILEEQAKARREAAEAAAAREDAAAEAEALAEGEEGAGETEEEESQE
jgi:large subunit ribosomal protein L25